MFAGRNLAQHLQSQMEKGTATHLEKLTLASLLILDVNQEKQALAIINGVISDDPMNSRAWIWWSYLAVHFLQDQASLALADRELREIASNEKSAELIAAALLINAHVVGDINGSRLDDVQSLLECSVSHAGFWSSSHNDLAEIYVLQGMTQDAKEQSQAAFDCAFDDEVSISDEDLAWEVCITGRAQGKSYYKEALSELLSGQ